MTDIHKGSCLCGEIQYEINGEIGEPGLCHCIMCRKHHGAPFAALSGVKWSDFRITAGEDQLGRYQSSEKVVRTFCSNCGSSLQFCREGPKGMFALAISTLDTPFETQPGQQIFTDYKAQWWPLQHEIQYFPEWPE